LDEGIITRRKGQQLRKRQAHRGGGRCCHGRFDFHEQCRHVVGPCLVILCGDKAQFPQVVRIAQRMGALVIRKVRFPVIMDHRPAERAKNAHRLHRLVAALGMDLIRRQALGAGDMQPM